MESPEGSQVQSYDGEVADSITSAWNPTSEKGSQQQQTPQRKPQSRVQTQPRRVCAECRRRKVGCDKKQPCQHCKKSGADCVYPPDGRYAARQLFPDAQMWEQLRRLEPVFKSLVDCMEPGSLEPAALNASSAITQALLRADPQGGDSRIDTIPPPPTPPHSVESANHHVNASIQPPQRASEDRNTAVQSESHRTQSSLGQQSPPQDTDSTAGPPSSADIHTMTGDSSQGYEGAAWSPYGTTSGKLVKDDGRRRYVSGTFWEALHAQGDMDEAMVSDDESEQEAQSFSFRPEPSSSYAPIFGSCALENELSSLHPPLQHRLRAWQLFKTNVHPVATILHVPSIEPILVDGLQNLQPMEPPLEALMFVIYFGAVNSLSADECERQFGSEQLGLLAKFRRGADNALARSGLIDTDNVLTLQTFVIYLVLLRSHDPTYSFNMTGLAARLAQSLGMHRDGSTLNLSPFDAEIRRRLWWSICILDTPASEDYSCSPSLMELSSFDARPPLNINDADLRPDMTDYPVESKGITDMSFTAARCWSSDMWRTMIDTRRVDPNTGKSFKAMTMMEKQSWINKQEAKIKTRLALNKNSKDSLYCLISSFVETIICNLRLLVVNPLGSGTTLTEDQRKLVFRDAIDCMTYSYRLRTDSRVAQWSWLTRCYNEWHSFAIILSELSNRPLTRDADKAWRAVEQNAVLRWDSSVNHDRVHQWRSVMRSMEKAKRRRRKELGRRQSTSSGRSASVTSGRSQPVQDRNGPSGLTRQNVTLAQADLNQVGLLDSPDSHCQDVGSVMYNTNENALSLTGPLDACNAAAEDVQLYFDSAFFNTPGIEASLAAGN